MMKSSSEMELLKELTELSVITKQKNRDDVEIKLQIQVYIKKLSTIPADMAIHAIRSWPEQNTPDAKWWPSWSELKALFSDALEDRKLMIKACEGE